jgi:hypothetical protein
MRTMIIATLKASKLSLALFYIDTESTSRACFSFSVWRLGCTLRLDFPFLDPSEAIV